MNKYKQHLALMVAGLALLPYLVSPAHSLAVDSSRQNNGIARAEEIGNQDPGNGNPGILPTNPFYFLKEWRRSFIKVFIADSQKRIEAELGDLSERLAEIKKLESLGAKAESVKDALVKYETNLSNFNGRLNGIRQGENSDSLLNKIIDSALKHNNFLEDLKIKFADEPELNVLINNIQDQLGGIIAAVQRHFKKSNDFKAKLERAVFGNADAKEIPVRIIKELRAAEVLSRVEKKSSSDYLVKIGEIKNALMKNIAGEIEKAGDKELAEILNPDFFKKIPANQIRNFEEVKNSLNGKGNKGATLAQ